MKELVPRHDLKTAVDKLDYANLQERILNQKKNYKTHQTLSIGKQLHDIYNTEDIFAILKQRCGNCAAFHY